MKKFLSVLCCLLTMACVDQNKIPNGEYVMIEAPENAEITLTIDQNKFSGLAAINRYFGNFQTDGTAVKFSPVGSTMMAGPENLMAVEYQYLQDLEKITQWSFQDNKLVLSDNNGPVMTFQKQ